MHHLIRLCAVSLFISLMPACVSSIEPDIRDTPTPESDGDYFSALTKATRERTIFRNFETRYILSAVYLSPDFRRAFASRRERVYEKGEAQFQEAEAKAGFFLSLNAPGGDERIDLTNTHHWTLRFESRDGPLKPVLVKRISDKERWRAFFPTVNNWSTEYLVIFDTPSVDANSAQMVEKTGVQLTLANADAKVQLAW